MKVTKVVVKDVVLNKEDVYTFTEWDRISFLMTGELCLIGSTIYQARIRIVDSSFRISGKPLLIYSLPQPISLPQIQSAQSSLMALYSQLSHNLPSFSSLPLSECSSVRIV